MIHALDSAHASRRARPLCAAAVVCAALTWEGLGAPRSGLAQGIGQQIGQGIPPAAGFAQPPAQVSAPPPRFGHYKTQWRRWQEDEPSSAAPRTSVTPAVPPRVVVPGPREESPTGAPTPPPPDRPAAARAPSRGRSPPRRWPAPPAPSRAATPADRLPADVAAAKQGTPAEQAAFTGRLVPALLAAHDPEERCRIVATAAAFDTPAAVAICTGAMQAPSPRVRMAGCAAWVVRGGPEAVRLLAERCQTDQDLGVRLRAITSLGEVGGSAAIAVLGKALDDDDAVIRNRAQESLVRASGRDFGDDVALWRAWIADPADPATRWTLSEGWRRLF